MSFSSLQSPFTKLLSILVVTSSLLGMVPSAPAKAASNLQVGTNLFGWNGFSDEEIDSTIVDAQNIFGVSSSKDDLRRIFTSSRGPDFKVFVDWAKAGQRAEDPDTALTAVLQGITEYLPSAFLGADKSAMTPEDWQTFVVEGALVRAKGKATEELLTRLGFPATEIGRNLAYLSAAKQQVSYISTLALSAFSDRPYRQTFGLYKENRRSGMIPNASYSAVEELQTQEIMDNVAELRYPCETIELPMCTVEKRAEHLPIAREKLAKDLEATYFSVLLAEDDQTQTSVRDLIDGTVSLVKDYEDTSDTDLGGLIAVQTAEDKITLKNTGFATLSNVAVKDASGATVARTALLGPGGTQEILDTGSYSLLINSHKVEFSVGGIPANTTAGTVRRTIWMDAIRASSNSGTLNQYDFSVSPITFSGRTPTIHWDLGGQSESEGLATSHVFQCFGSYDIQASASYGTASTKRSTSVTVPSPWKVDFTTADGEYAAAPDVPVKLTADPSIPTDRGLAVTWDFGNGATAEGFEAVHSFSTLGYQTVTMTVTDAASGCPAQRSEHRMLIARSDQWIPLPSSIGRDLTLSSKVAGYLVTNPGYGGGTSTTVETGATLTIPAGVRIKGASNDIYWGRNQNPLRVKGNLRVEGTAEVPVIWTSFRDNSLGGEPSGDGHEPHPGDFVGVIAEPGAQVSMAHVVSRFSASFIEARENSSVRVSNLSVRQATGYVGGILNGWYVTGIIKAEGSARVDLSYSDIENVGNGYCLDTTEGRYVKAHAVTLRCATGINVHGNRGPSISNATFVGSTEPVKTTAAASGFTLRGTRLIDSFARISVQPGSIASGTTRWSADLPYVITESWLHPLDVPHGSTLEMAPGIAIKSYRAHTWNGARYTPLRVSGRLLVGGTPEKPVNWTSLTDAAVGGASNSLTAVGDSPAPGDWQGIHVQTGGVADVYYLSATYPAQVLRAEAGSSTSIRGTRIDNASADYTLGGGVLHNQDAATFEVRDTAVSTQGSNGPLVTLTGSNNASLFENVEISGPATAVQLYGSSRPVLRNTKFQNVVTAVAATPENSGFAMSGSVAEGGTPKITVSGGTFPQGTTTWGADLPYEMQFYPSTTVPAGASLDVLPGVVLKTLSDGSFFYGRTHGSFEVAGKLNILGTRDKPVQWTSWRNASVGGHTDTQSGGSPTESDWEGPRLLAGGSGAFNNLEATHVREFVTAAEGSRVEFDGLTVTQSASALGLIRDYGSSGFTLKNSTLDGSGAAAVILRGPNQQPVIENTMFSGSWPGVQVEGDADTKIRGSKFLSSGFAVYTTGTKDVEATRNWWGSPEKPASGRYYARPGISILIDPWCLNATCQDSLVIAPAPTISGGTIVGQTLTASAGTWEPAPVELAYQWNRNDTAIDGATGPTYTLTEEDHGTVITVTVTGTKAGYTSQTHTSTGTQPITVTDAIDAVYADARIAKSLGLPTGPQINALRDGGACRNYEGGAIYWSPATGAQVIAGEFLDLWLAADGQDGALGYPSSGKVRGKGSNYQEFQNGRMYASQSVGSYAVQGEIFKVYAEVGFENGLLGLPTSDKSEIALGAGRFQSFQGGNVYWSPESGAHIVRESILTAYLTDNAAEGALGYPVAPEVVVDKGSAYQDFEGGRITWTRKNGATIQLSGIQGN